MGKSVGPPENYENEPKEQQANNFGLINVSSNSQAIIGPMEIIEIANSAHKKFTLLLQQEASKPQSENVLTHELAIYKSCLHIDSDRLK